MADKTPEDSQETQTGALDLNALSGLDFGPSWADETNQKSRSHPNEGHLSLGARVLPALIVLARDGEIVGRRAAPMGPLMLVQIKKRAIALALERVDRAYPGSSKEMRVTPTGAIPLSRSYKSICIRRMKHLTLW